MDRNNWSQAQKRGVSNLYRVGKKLQNSISHVQFLSQSEKSNVIPKFCKLKSVPGRTENKCFKEQLESMILKQNLHHEREVLDRNTLAMENSICNIRTVFNNFEATKIIEKHESHCRKVCGYQEEKSFKKLRRDIASSAVRKKRRRFRRKVDPPIKKARKRKKKPRRGGGNGEGERERVETLRGEGVEAQLGENWNGGVKNFSSKPTSKEEERLLNRNRKFAPMELDPPQLRNQQELDRWLRSLHLQYQFFDQPDSRSELEKKFYQPNKNYEPSIVSYHLETFKGAMQREYDQWKPPRYIKDNISRGERAFLREARKDDSVIYKWEDKGSSFTKMDKVDYVQVGEKNLENSKFYSENVDKKKWRRK